MAASLKKKLSSDFSVSIINKTRGQVPRLPFEAIARNILPRHELSVAFVSPTEARKIARTYKHKDYAANVLSFRLSKNSGEVIICPATAKSQAKSFGTSHRDMILKLFIHGLLHLEGHTHGGTMDRQESRLIEKYSKA